jgi:hypothetical protein
LYIKVQYLGGGADYKDMVANIMKRIFTYDLGSQFCWEGIRKVNKKRPFKDLTMKTATFGAYFIGFNPL